jgi:inner membrane transporter RhtA
VIGRPSGTLSGVGLVLVAIASVQLGAGIATSFIPDVGPEGAVWLRVLIAAVLLGVVWPPSRLPLPWRLPWSRSTWLAVAAFGVTTSLMNWAFYEAIDRIPLGIAVTLEFIGPLALALALSRRWLDAGWAVAAGAGIVLLTVVPDAAGARLDPVGVVVALVAGALWAGYILLSHRVGRLVPGTRGLSAALLVGAVVLAPVGLTAGTSLLDPRVLALAAVVAVLSTALAYGLELEALRRLSSRLFGVLTSLDPVMAAVVGAVLLGQLLTGRQWAGVLVICAVSVGATLTARRSPAGDGAPVVPG